MNIHPPPPSINALVMALNMNRTRHFEQRSYVAKLVGHEKWNSVYIVSGGSYRGNFVIRDQIISFAVKRDF